MSSPLRHEHHEGTRRSRRGEMREHESGPVAGDGRRLSSDPAVPACRQECLSPESNETSPIKVFGMHGPETHVRSCFMLPVRDNCVMNAAVLFICAWLANSPDFAATQTSRQETQRGVLDVVVFYAGAPRDVARYPLPVRQELQRFLERAGAYRPRLRAGYDSDQKCEWSMRLAKVTKRSWRRQLRRRRATSRPGVRGCAPSVYSGRDSTTVRSVKRASPNSICAIVRTRRFVTCCACWPPTDGSARLKGHDYRTEPNRGSSRQARVTRRR